MNTETTNIDIIIPWVDGNDPEWQRSYMEYAHLSNDRDSNTISRYRDWDNLQYLFRGIEKFMPWVRKVHFVTCGQKPKWLNINAPKLNFVKHKDFIPDEYLPTFSIRPIELNIHRIPGLSDKFIYFNDDFFVIRPMRPSDYFVNGLPVDMAALDVLRTKESRCLVMANNTILINKHFVKNDVMREHRRIWYKLSYGKYLIKTIHLNGWRFFPGFQNTHLPQPFLKSSFDEVWKVYEKELHETSLHKFRDISDVNQSLVRYWQIVSGGIYPHNVYKSSKYFKLVDANIDQACNAIRERKGNTIILNDSDDITLFEEAKRSILSAFNSILPEKSSFEL